MDNAAVLGVHISVEFRIIAHATGETVIAGRDN
jgi:hypothetical protein